MNEIVNGLKFNANTLNDICYHMLFVARQRMSNIVGQVLAHFGNGPSRSSDQSDTFYQHIYEM